MRLGKLLEDKLPLASHSLAGTLTHLSALAAETAHALLAPLPAHTGVDTHTHFDGVIFLDAVRFEGSTLQTVSAEDQTELVRRDEFAVLDLELQCLDGHGRVHLVGGATNKDLHGRFFLSFKTLFSS